MKFKNILVETKDNVGLIIINRPKVLNALNLETIGELENAVTHLDGEKDIKVLVITGANDKAFVSGADIAALREMTPSRADEFSEHGHRCLDTIERCSKPVIAAVAGYALGGGTELALACDIVIAADNAKFGLPEVKLGIYPGFGGTQRLPRLIGAGRARELIFTGRNIDAREAYEWGLVNHVYPADRLRDETMKLAAEIAGNGPIAVTAAKRVINEGLGQTVAEGLENERAQFSTLFSTKDCAEGLSAFLEKRRPAFKGK